MYNLYWYGITMTANYSLLILHVHVWMWTVECQIKTICTTHLYTSEYMNVTLSWCVDCVGSMGTVEKAVIHCVTRNSISNHRRAWWRNETVPSNQPSKLHTSMPRYNTCRAYTGRNPQWKGWNGLKHHQVLLPLITGFLSSNIKSLPLHRIKFFTSHFM